MIKNILSTKYLYFALSGLLIKNFTEILLKNSSISFTNACSTCALVLGFLERTRKHAPRLYQACLCGPTLFARLLIHLSARHANVYATSTCSRAWSANSRRKVRIRSEGNFLFWGSQGCYLFLWCLHAPSDLIARISIIYSR